MEQPPVHVQIAHGRTDIDFLREILCPSLRNSTRRPIVLWTIGYDGTLFTDHETSGLEVRSVRQDGKELLGFGACHNRLFKARDTADDFVLLNPDCILVESSIDQLLARKANHMNAALVEGRQWPFEHPKEYDPETGITPWASGAFCLVSGEFFSRCGGFDEAFFLYLEDVDLSWRAWLSGFDVIYEPTALVQHFSGGPFYRQDLRSAEQYFSPRNFLLLARKYFGAEGEEIAVRMIRRVFSPALANQIVEDHVTRYRDRVISVEASRHPMVKILAFNQFHELRS